MPDEKQTGPWLLALGTLGIGIGAVVMELLRQRRNDRHEGALRGGGR